MTAQLIDGNALAAQTRAEVAHRTAALKARGIQSYLAIILVGDNPASQVYVKSKVADSEQTGLQATLERCPADMSQADLLARIARLNADERVHGILVQLPLPAHMDAGLVIEAIAPEKDVDGFHIASAGALIDLPDDEDGLGLQDVKNVQGLRSCGGLGKVGESGWSQVRRLSGVRGGGRGRLGVGQGDAHRWIPYSVLVC